MYKIASVKSPDSEQAVRDIMRAVYEEQPSHWPYGLDITGHDDVFLIREKQANRPVGFVGWQTFYEPAQKSAGRKRKVGYYSIGILPEFRKQGFAKEAVEKIIHFKKGGYDEVRAFIMPSNTPSLNLAARLRIPVDTDL